MAGRELDDGVDGFLPGDLPCAYLISTRKLPEVRVGISENSSGFHQCLVDVDIAETSTSQESSTVLRGEILNKIDTGTAAAVLVLQAISCCHRGTGLYGHYQIIQT